MTQPIRTDYLGHDRVYQRYRAAGQPGWCDAETLVENLRNLAMVIERLNPQPGSRILELGCGAGNLSLALADRGFQVTGIDIAPSAIAWAKDLAVACNNRPDFQIGDVVNLPLAYSEAFDYVLDGYCLHCIVGPDRRQFLRGAFRALRPGGVFHVATMCNEYSGGGLKDHYDPLSRCLLFNGVASRYFGKVESILDDIREAGFTIGHQQVETYPESIQDTLRVDCVKDTGMS